LGSKNIATFYQNDGYGQAGLRGLEEEAARLQEQGVDDAGGGRVDHGRGPTHLGVHALRLPGSRADRVALSSGPTAAADRPNECQRLDYHPQILSTVTLLAPSLIGNPAMQGALYSVFLRLPSVVLGEGNGDPIADRLYQEVILAYAPEIATA